MVGRVECASLAQIAICKFIAKKLFGHMLNQYNESDDDYFFFTKNSEFLVNSNG